jgi:hypothetical protein
VSFFKNFPQVFYIKNATQVCPQLILKFDNYQALVVTGDTATIKPPENALKFSVSSNCQEKLVISPDVLIQEDHTYVIGKKNIEFNPAIPPEQYELTIE